MSLLRHNPMRRVSDRGRYAERPQWFTNGPWTAPTEAQVHILMNRFTEIFKLAEKKHILPAPLEQQLDSYLKLVRFCFQFSRLSPRFQNLKDEGRDTTEIRRQSSSLTLLWQWLLHDQPPGMKLKYLQLDQQQKSMTLPFLGPGCSVSNLENVFEYIEQLAIPGRPPPSSRRWTPDWTIGLSDPHGEDGGEIITGLFPLGLELDEGILTATIDDIDRFQRWLCISRRSQNWSINDFLERHYERYTARSPLNVEGEALPNVLTALFSDYVGTLQECDPSHPMYQPTLLRIYDRDLTKGLEKKQADVRRRTFHTSRMRENAEKIYDIAAEAAGPPDNWSPAEQEDFRKRRTKELKLNFPSEWRDLLVILERQKIHKQMMKWLDNARPRQRSYETLEVPRATGRDASTATSDPYISAEEQPISSDTDDESYGETYNEAYEDEARFVDDPRNEFDSD